MRKNKLTGNKAVVLPFFSDQYERTTPKAR